MPHPEMKRQLHDLIAFLRATSRYKALVEKLESANWPPRSFIFEAIFAGKFEAANHPLRYEACVNKLAAESMDFVYPAMGTTRVCFELVSPHVSDSVRRASGPHPTTIPGLDVESIFLHSDDPDEHLRPEAQTIRLQEKILEKVGKLPEPDDAIFGLLVVDCTDIHSGMFDDDDCRMLMFGQTRLPQYQEYWRGNRIHGLLEETNDLRGAALLRERMSGVIIVPELTDDWDPLPRSFLVVNKLRPHKHLSNLRQELSQLPPLAGLVEVSG